MRVLLRQIWRDRRLTWPSWGLQRECDIDEVEKKLWKSRNVDLVGEQIEKFTEKLGALLPS